MRAALTDGCGCFPTGRHYAGIAHLLRAVVRGLAEDLAAADAAWDSVVAGQYRIRQRMGAGASGVIYEAVRTSDSLPVAIKLLRAAAAHDTVASWPSMPWYPLVPPYALAKPFSRTDGHTASSLPLA